MKNIAKALEQYPGAGIDPHVSYEIAMYAYSLIQKELASSGKIDLMMQLDEALGLGIGVKN